MDNPEDLLREFAKMNNLQEISADEAQQPVSQEVEEPSQVETEEPVAQEVEKPVEEPQSSEPQQVTEEPVIKAEEPAQTQVDFNDLWSQKYGETHGDIDSFFNKYNEYKTKAEEQRWGDQFDDSAKGKIEALLTSEGDINWNELKRIAEANTMDIDGMSEFDVLEKKFSLEGRSQREIELRMKQYSKLKSVDREDLDQDELDRLDQIELEFLNEVRQGREFLKNYKNEQATAIQPLKKQAPAQDNSQLEALKQQWVDKVNSSLSDFNKVTFNLDKEKTYDFDITDEIRGDIKSGLEGIDSFYKNYVTENGFDFNKARQDLFVLKNWEKIIKTLTAQSFNNGTEKTVKEISNVDFEGTSNAPKPKKSIEQQMAEQMFKNI